MSNYVTSPSARVARRLCTTSRLSRCRHTRPASVTAFFETALQPPPVGRHVFILELGVAPRSAPLDPPGGELRSGNRTPRSARLPSATTNPRLGTQRFVLPTRLDANERGVGSLAVHTTERSLLHGEGIASGTKAPTTEYGSHAALPVLGHV